MLIPDSKIDEVRERLDIVAIVTRHGVELKKSGRSMKGLCPFHQEKSPSFYVWPDAGRFKCFGCAAGGDGISFVQRLLGKGFVDTVRDLANEVGVDLESAVDPAMREKAQLKEATDLAEQHFKERLWDTAVGHHAREYLRARGLTDELMRAFGLGFAPVAWTELADRQREAGLLSFAEKAGLVAPRRQGDGFYDVFRGRVMIPIRSPEGRVIAFGARLLEGDEGPKYLNSKESKLYNKSDILYGVDQARDEIRRRKSAVLVEGYFDCIGLHQAGVKNSVALCSTALTPGHLSLLSRLEAKELVLLLDGDEAGRKAVERLAGPILAAGVTARVAALPDGEDPDTWARAVGPEAVQARLKAAPALTEYLFTTLLPRGPESSFEEKMSALDRLRPVAKDLPVGLTRSAFFAALARASGLAASELEASFRGKPSAPVKPVPKPEAPLEQRPPDQFEAAYVAFVLKDRRLLAKDPYHVTQELKHTAVRNVLAGLESGDSAEDVLFDAPVGLRGALERALETLPKDEQALEPAFLTVCRRLKVRFIDEHLRHIARETRQVEGANELTDDARDLLKQRGELLALKRELLSQR